MECKFIDCPGDINTLLHKYKNRNNIVVVPGTISQGHGLTGDKFYKIPMKGEEDEKITPRKFKGSLYMSYLDDLINFIKDNSKNKFVIPKLGHDDEKKYDIFDKVVRVKLWDELHDQSHVTLAWG